MKAYPRTTPSGARTRPRTGFCSLCKRKILTAVYDALPVQLDRQALSLVGELDAALQGLQTWWVVGDNLYRRHAADIQASPRGFGGLIYRDHRCSVTEPLGLALALVVTHRYDQCTF